MFVDLSWSHIVLFLVIALVVVGPKDLPKLMRKIGQWMAKARSMADQFRSSFDEMARQSELDELRKEIEALRNAKPLAETERQLNEALKVPDVSLDKPAEPADAAKAEALAEEAHATDETPTEPDPTESPAYTPAPIDETADADPMQPLTAEPSSATEPADMAMAAEPEPPMPEAPIEGGYVPPKP